MNLEQAIERCEAHANRTCDCGRCDFCVEINENPLSREALTLVLAAAKRPYALGEGEREALLSHRDKFIREDSELYDALTEALSLSPPFTREELETLRGFACCADQRWEWDEKEAALAAKLDAYLESLPQDATDGRG